MDNALAAAAAPMHSIATVKAHFFPKLVGATVRVQSAVYMDRGGEAAVAVKVWNPDTKTVSGAIWYVCVSDLCAL